MHEPECPLQPGSVAPGFTLYRAPGQSLTLGQLRGRRLILAFYPALWEPVTDAQIEVHRRCVLEFERRSAQLIGISCDSVWSQQAFCRYHGIGFPLLSDFEPRSGVASAYGVSADGGGTSKRAVFVIDECSVVAWSRVYPTNLVPAVREIIAALDRLPAPTIPRVW